MSEIGFLLRNLGLEERFTFESEKNLDYIEGRSASIIVDGNKWGTFGEVSPKILSNFGIGYPLVAFEIFIPRNMDWLK